MASDREIPGAPESLVPAIMDLQVREEHAQRGALGDCLRGEDTLDGGTQSDAIPGKLIPEGRQQDQTPGLDYQRRIHIQIPTPWRRRKRERWWPRWRPGRRWRWRPGDCNKRYTYAPLSQTDEIRCLILESGTGDADDPLVCSLHHHSLDQEPDFEAISYAWGSSDKTHTILCDGRRMAITKNLHTCLLQTRLPDRTRRLWADSICINQDDPKEKGHQVGMMSRIYSEARRVLICLGPDDRGHAKDAARLVSEVSQWVQKQVDLTDGKRNSFPYIKSDEWPMSDQRWVTLFAMVRSHWFGRGWVIQEAGLAKDAQILWGDVEIGWVDLLRVLRLAGARGGLAIHEKFRRSFTILHFTALTTKHPAESDVLNILKPISLLEFLLNGEGLQFKDNRDRIYAFLGLSEAAHPRHGLEVHYDEPYLQVYSEFASWYIHRTKSTEILDFVYHDEDTLLAGVPSWVPQWHMPLRGADLNHPSDEPILSVSKGHDYAALAAVQGNVLKVQGLLIDRIVSISQEIDGDVSIEEMTELWVWFEQHSIESIYRETHPLMAFMQAMLLGADSITVEDHTRMANNAEYILRLRRGKPLPSHPSLDLLRSISEDHHGDATATHQWIQTGVRNRRLCLTARGYCGVVPGIAQEGDLSCIVFGTKSPSIIRQTGSDRHYKVLGQGFFVSTRQEKGWPFPDRLGSGRGSHEDWLDWNLEEQEFLLC